jgi:hypothetical protein
MSLRTLMFRTLTGSQRYIEERNKRLRPEGLGQFVRVADSAQLKYLGNDPWVDHAALNAKAPVLSDGDDIKFLVLGAGYGGLLFAVHLIEAGFSAADIRFVDAAGGFGGTWYWNRYPGLMCDTESYIYMPLLEETGYMPRFKYAYGPGRSPAVPAGMTSRSGGLYSSWRAGARQSQRRRSR